MAKNDKTDITNSGKIQRRIMYTNDKDGKEFQNLEVHYERIK